MENFSADSRVWVYQADRTFNEHETIQIQAIANDFAHRWDSHNRALKAKAEIVYNRFLVLIVDENQADASGCSIDKSVHFIENLGKEFGVDFFNRLLFAYLDENKELQVASKKAFQTLFDNEKINESTIVFDTLVNNFQDYQNSFLKKLGESWHAKFCKSLV